MKKLRIIVPKGSELDSYLTHGGFNYDKVRLSKKTCYKMDITQSLQLIEFLVSKFCIKDFQIQSHDDVVTFLVCS